MRSTSRSVWGDARSRAPIAGVSTDASGILHGVDGPAAYPSVGEAAVADYLTSRRIRFEYEPQIGARYPDFLAHAPEGDIVLDVYEPVLRLRNSSGAFDSVKPVSGAFGDRKRKQAQAARKAGLPFMVVVGSANSDITYDWMAAVGALRGGPGVSFLVGPGAPTDPEPTPTLIGVGRTGGGDNTSFSALAVLHTFNPTLWRLRLAQWELVRHHEPRLPDDHDRRIRALMEICERYSDIEADVTERGLYLPNVRRVRLGIYHNPNAAIPLSRTFGGAHDEQWDEMSYADGRVVYCEVALGRAAQEWKLLED